MDIIENLAIQRAKELFRADHINVQPHSGAQANMAAYYAILDHGDTIMGLNLTHGGHLTHGDKATFSGKYFNSVPYGLDRETERIDYAELEKLAAEHHPKLIITGASAYPRVIDFERFRFIADRCGAKLMVDIAHIAGLVAAGLHPSPVPYADIVTSTTHKTLRGTRGGFIMCRQELAAAIDKSVFPRLQGGPLMHSIAAKAVTFYEALQPEFVDYQRAVLNNARVLADELQKDGVRIVSGGTDNHIVLVDLASKGISGPEAQDALQAAGIVANSNTVPFAATASRLHATGIRFGTPAVTTRGFGTEEMKQVAVLILKVLSNINDKELQKAVHAEVIGICQRFAVPGIDD